jgi:surface carbohydrate biosynthesis protein
MREVILFVNSLFLKVFRRALLKIRLITMIFVSLDLSIIEKSVDWLVYGERSHPLCDLLETSGKRYRFLSVNSRGLNVWMLLRTVLCRQKELSFFESYVLTSIRLISPKGLITLLDNDHRFWKISSSLDGIVIVVIQNARRFFAHDVFGEPALAVQNRGKFTHLLCHSTAIASKYEEYNDIENIHVIGSYKNNQCPVDFTDSEGRGMLWISSIEKYQGNEFFTSPRPEYGSISYDDYNLGDEIALKNIFRFCSSFNLPITIAGRSFYEDSAEEIRWFKSRFAMYEFDYIARDSWDSTYKAIDRSSVIATVDSTLGLEALARGKKVVFLPYRESVTRDRSNGFGWPDDVGMAGPFWTSDTTYLQVEALLSEVVSMSDSDWALIVERYVPQILGIENGNPTLKSILKSV